ncbi:MAG: FAD-dependent oxidoreductase [Ilumatobacter sp.]|uniref:FAD-dependent oxidoreductase n=1 Tax=Ilumatobacter sp. TaxID=1967498 RepID=UPI002618AEFE|nr:FAD-dependent oxidoreductase [Ilumatobacter sp.]MDJ0767567.1 FAD-dependent oxidoreductase [Ilumatobacter sp.]
MELEYYDTNIPCLAACPVHTNAGMYVAAIADGDDELAYLTARLPNPFASVCGRVCAAPCEDACRRGEIDRPIAIRALKRFVTEQFGPERGNGRVWNKVAAPPRSDKQERVGIVGGGPAGMACAHDLRRHGYQVTVYEATDKLGGAMWLGIPEYRLDRDVLGADIQAILDLGVEVHYDTRLGVDVTLDELMERHDALFLGIGATLGRGLDIEGGDADGVFKAIEFLINMNRGFSVDVGERVVVIGGGDVAMDAARTALRASEYGSEVTSEATVASDDDIDADQRSAMTEAIDVARTAARAGARQVTVISLESRAEMPAHDFEVEEAEHEGIAFVPRRGPARILVEDGRVAGIETIGVNSVFDADGRFAPDFDETDRQVFDADTVILAIGQAIDLDALGASGPEVSPRRTIQIDNDTGRTTMLGVWSGGDAAKGPRTLIDAIADGRRSAADIHRAFGGDVDDLEQEQPATFVKLSQFHRLDDDYDQIARVSVPTLDTGRRIGLAEVELGFTEQQARCEAARCLRCFANIILDVDKCVLCALCADVCPVDVISLVPSDEVDGGEAGSTALLLDEERCIRCALCIERCPPDALSMGMWKGVGVP